MEIVALPRRALSVRQPWAELILGGQKSLEIRSRPTKVRGWVQIYAAIRREDGPWQLGAAHDHGLDLGTLQRGWLLGMAEIVGCRRVSPADSREACFAIPADQELYGWQMANPRRHATPRKPSGQPQPSFFFVD
ncbi:MAG: ASCH domain-containing protein [Candidatus Eremiobacteraeota bacterium]|nr:ASCH domain-containing protein [Candidatus Eremiobacteraeota bacterium]MCW5868189.1 ASCH domain-containing protein [Candidatus Eremiobacteraeota bacterium]